MSRTRSNPAIVIVEDEPGILIEVHRILKRFAGNCDIESMSRGLDVFDVVTRRPVPLLIARYRLSEGNGIQIAELAKSASPLTRVVLVPDLDTPALAAQAAESKAVDDYIPWPLLADRLEMIVRQALASTTPSA